jgi:hypothetical protein
MLTGIAGAIAVAVMVAVRGPEVLGTLGSCSLAAAIGAVVAHGLTLACRCEAWRVAAGSIADRRLERVTAHAAGGAGAAAGMLQGAGTAPVRAVALRRIAPGSPSTAQLVVAEIPVFLIDAALTAAVLAVAVAALPLAPPWAGPGAAIACIGALVVLRAWLGSVGGPGPAAGLRVLRDARRRWAVLALLVIVTALGVARSWLVLAGMGLPHDLATAALAFIALGVFGLLPIGPGSTPVAMLAITGASDATTAIAAGIAVTATSWLGVGLYASIGAAAWIAASRPAVGGGPTRSASSVDHPNWRAASPSPSSGL